ncbi:MAG: hypothetical protein Q8T09_23610 [Candidatus Melainabacteria bacterium]|nr:hypothetical protein [Candidatus Melainabacteria bacterium]
MPFLFLLTALLLFFGFFVAFIFFCVLAWIIYKYFRNRKRARISRLLVYQKRLKTVVAELLKQINELDQISKYSGLDRDAAWSRKYDDTLKKLLSASDKLADSQTFIDMKELNAGQESLLYVVRTIHVVNYRMREMTPSENFDHLQQDTDFSRFESGGNERDARANAAKSESNGSEKTEQANSTLEVKSGGDSEARNNLDESASSQLTEPGSIIYLKKREQKEP